VRKSLLRQQFAAHASVEGVDAYRISRLLQRDRLSVRRSEGQILPCRARQGVDRTRRARI
jgi:hypothetical protein